jgi:glyoxylase-like metal-dependent hydrolase (beta-lactamase superfamily II)
VLVVDTGNVPSDGIKIVEKIKEITDKPIKYILMTHHHFDHTGGLISFPKDAVIISHTSYPKLIEEFYATSMKDLIETEYPAFFKTLKDDIEKMKKENDPKLAKVEDRLKRNEVYFEELKNSKIVYPNITFDSKMTITLGKYKVEVIYPGPGHTRSNIVVYFPSQKVIHMGDLLFNNQHTFIVLDEGSNTANWINIMNEFYKWDIEKVIAGHGDLGDKESLKKEAVYLTGLRAEVKKALEDGLTVEQAKEKISQIDWKNLPGTDGLLGSIEAIYKEMKEAQK